MSKTNKQDKRKKAQKMAENKIQIQADSMHCEMMEDDNYKVLSNRVEELEKRWQKISEEFENLKACKADELRNLSNAVEKCKTDIERIDFPKREEIIGRLLTLDDMISSGKFAEDNPLVQSILNKMREQFVLSFSSEQYKETNEMNPPMNDGGPIPTHSTTEIDVHGNSPKCEGIETKDHEEGEDAMISPRNSLQSQSQGETLRKNDEEQKESNDENSHHKEKLKEVILDQNNVVANLKKSLIEYLEEKMSKLENKLEAKVEQLSSVLSKQEENNRTYLENQISQLEVNGKGSINSGENVASGEEPKKIENIEKLEIDNDKSTHGSQKRNKEIEATGDIKHDYDEYSNALRDLESRISNLEKYGFTEWKEGSIFGNEDHSKELQELDMRLARLEDSSESEKIRRVAMRMVHLERDHVLMQKYVQKIEENVCNLLPHENVRSWQKNDSVDGRSMNYISNPTQYKEWMKDKHFAPRMQADEPLDPRLEEFLQQTALLNRTVQTISHRLNSLESYMKLGKTPSEPTDKDQRIKTTTPSWSSFQPIATATSSPNTDILGKALFRAADQGRLKDVRDLLNAGASVDFRSRSRSTALHAAAAHGHAEVVELLLDSGANASARNVGGLTPLHLAAQEGHAACLRALLRAGAPLEVVTRGGLTPLQLAIKWGSKEAAEVLHLAESGSTGKKEKE